MHWLPVNFWVKFNVLVTIYKNPSRLRAWLSEELPISNHFYIVWVDKIGILWVHQLSKIIWWSSRKFTLWNSIPKEIHIALPCLFLISLWNQFFLHVLDSGGYLGPFGTNAATFKNYFDFSFLILYTAQWPSMFDRYIFPTYTLTGSSRHGF